MPSSGHRKIGEQRKGFAAGELDGSLLADQRWRAEQLEARRHDDASFMAQVYRVG